MSTDENGFGPTPEELPYAGKGYYEVIYGASPFQLPILGRGTVAEDYDRHWLTLSLADAHSSADKTFTIRGHLNSQPSGVPPANRPEGMLFEIELNGVWLADEPLPEQVLEDLA